MPLSGPGYTGPNEVHYLFIDGGYFRKATEALANRYWRLEQILIDYSKLRGSFAKVFYYDCPPPRSKREPDADYYLRLEAYRRQIGDIHLSDGYHCVEGTTQGGPGKARQKQVDVKIAVDMLTHSHRRNMHQVTLLTGDLDFKPVLEALVQDGMFVTLWYDASSASKELIRAADAKRKLDLRELHCLLDDMIQGMCPFPDACGYMEKHTDGLQLVRTGSGPRGQGVELFQSDTVYAIVFPNEHNPGHFSHVSHDDLDFLELVFPHLWFDIQWE